MTKCMPQEIEVWYLIPALRRELAKVLVKEHGLKQKDVASLLGITEAAVSQYLKSKRGTEMKFTKKEEAAIKLAAKNMLGKKADTMKNLYDLCRDFQGSKTLCELHRKHDSSIPYDCTVCCVK